MTTCTRRIEWDAAHRVMRHESKCATLHGHRYAAEITCQGDLDSVGRVVDFGEIKRLVGAWVDEVWDHTTIYNSLDTKLEAFLLDEVKQGKREPYAMEGEPTAENIAAALLEVANLLLANERTGLRVIKVRVWETPNCYAEVVA